MKPTLENFKNFALNNPFWITIEYCEKLVKTLNIEAEELGSLLTEMHGTFYCPDDNMASKFDFNGEDELTEDIKELIGDYHIEKGISYDKAWDSVSKLFHCVAISYDNGFYGSQDFIFVDIAQVQKLI